MEQTYLGSIQEDELGIHNVNSPRLSVLIIHELDTKLIPITTQDRFKTQKIISNKEMRT